MTGKHAKDAPLPDAVKADAAADGAGQAARQVVFSFIGTYKKLNLYNAQHSIYKDALNHLKQVFDDFLGQFGEMRLQIERNRILCEDEVVYEGGAEPTDLVFILRRDGILWVGFKQGLALWELELFFSILHEYSVLEEDAEDDIASALWGYNLPSISYEAADLELGLDDDIDIGALACGPQSPEDIEDAPHTAGQALGDGPVIEVCENSKDASLSGDALFTLSREERDKLDEMITIEEKMDGSDHVVNVLLYIIETHCLPEDVDELLDYLVEAMKEALRKCRFSYLYTALTKVKRYLDKLKAANHWAVPNIERFFQKLSGKSFLEDLLQISEAVEQNPSEDLDALKKFISMLDAEAITALASIMLQNRSDRLHQVLAACIVHLAGKDFKPLERVLFSSDKTMAGRMVYLLRFFQDSHSRQILVRLLNDDAQLVRKQALKTYLRRKDSSLEATFALIDDADPKIRSLLLQHLGQTRDRQAEDQLLKYLDTTRITDPQHFMEVCKTLGKCASDRSIPFLKKLLFRWPGLGFLRHHRSVQHLGALCALKELDTKKAQALMHRANQGFLKNLFRSA